MSASTDTATHDTASHDTAPHSGPVQAGSRSDPLGTRRASPDGQPLGVPDEAAAGAVELARAAAVREAGTSVGEHLGVEVEDACTVTHSFDCTDPAYVGWRWTVTVARAPDHDQVTVDEVVLLPGAGALVAPEWVPWSERLRPGDLSPGDLLPPQPDDPRLVPGYADVEAEQLPFDLHRDLGLGRPRVLSLDGRLFAAERWYQGVAGPGTPMAKAAPADCGSCGFLVPLAGALGRVFGACANAMAADDGRVVALGHGCGAHSETVVDNPESSYAGMAVEDDEFEVVDRAGDAGAPAVAGTDVGRGAGATESNGEPVTGADPTGSTDLTGTGLAGGLVDESGASSTDPA